jgi:hypothetical protein
MAWTDPVRYLYSAVAFADHISGYGLNVLVIFAVQIVPEPLIFVHPGFLLKYFYFLAYIFMELYYEFQVFAHVVFFRPGNSHTGQGNSTSLAKKARLSFAGHGV